MARVFVRRDTCRPIEIAQYVSYGRKRLVLRVATALIASRSRCGQLFGRNPTRPLRTELDLLSVAVHPRQREHVAGAKQARAVEKEEEVRVHSPFRMPLVGVDEIVHAPR